MTMTDPVFEGVYGTYTIDATDRREVLGYRLALTAAALGQAGLLLQWRQLGPELVWPWMVLMAVGLGLALRWIHIYLVPLHRTLQLFWLLGCAGALVLAARSGPGAMVAAVASQPLWILAIGPFFAALAGVGFKEFFCFRRPEAIGVTLLLGYHEPAGPREWAATGALPAQVPNARGGGCGRQKRFRLPQGPGERCRGSHTLSLISLVDAGKDFGIRTLFENLSLHIGAGERLGLIGPNGAGKSTLLKVLAGIEPLGSGQRRCAPRTRVVLVDQEPGLDPEHTVLEQVFAGSGEKMALLRQHTALSQAVADGPDNAIALAQLSDLHGRMDQLNAWGLEQQCREVLERLGISDIERKVGDLSGGYRKRVALAAALVAEPDVLLLDEPTNHLDANGVEWLQSYLGRFPGALVLVTLDRYVLDRVTRRIVEVDRGLARSYAGNYATYLTHKAEEEASEASSAAKFKGTLRRELAWLRQGPKARSTKQKARIQRIEEMREAPQRQGRGQVSLATSSRRLGKRAITAEELGVSAGEGAEARALLRAFSYDFSPEDRVGIIGPNGVGKSSLLEVIAGRRQPSSGSLELGATVKLAYFDQHSDVLLKPPAGWRWRARSSVPPSCWSASCFRRPSSTNRWPSSPAASGDGCTSAGC